MHTFHILWESWLGRYFFSHENGCTCRRMLHTTDPEFPSMIVSGNLPSLTLHVNEQKASTPLSSTDQINSRSLVFNLSGLFTWQSKRYVEIKTSNPVFMHWVDLNFFAPHFNFIIRESQTCHSDYHNGCTCCFGKFTFICWIMEQSYYWWM